MSAKKHPKVAAFALCQVISYSFHTYSLMVLFALCPVLIQSTKSSDTNHTVKYIWHEPRICFCLSTFYFYFLLKAKGKLLLFSFTHLVTRQFLSDDLETERLKPVGCEHCGP